MGSGVLLAILVALWFIVLVPMVVTRGDLATAPAEPMRVLRRRSDRSPMSNNAASSDSTSRNAASRNAASSNATSRNATSSNATADAENMLTEPIPRLPRRIPGATLINERPPVPTAERPGTQVVTSDKVADPLARDRSSRSDIDIRARRRRMLIGMVAFAGLWALFAAFWQPVLWWPQIVLDLVVFSYLVFLRLEAQREQDRQERRRARATARVSLPEDRTERSVRRHTQYQAHVTAATEHQSIALDDDDPGFAEMPTWQPAGSPVTAATDAEYWATRKAV